MVLRAFVRAAVIAGLAAVAGCKSFTFEAETANLGGIKTAWLIVASKDLVQADSEDAIAGNIEPDQQDRYLFFSQLLPLDGETWEVAEAKGSWKLEPEASGTAFSLEIDDDLIEEKPDSEVVLIVRFTDDTWRCAKEPLTPEGEPGYTIGDSILVPRR